MLISCGGRANGRGASHREDQRKRKIQKRTEPDLENAGGWRYVAEGGANVVFRHEDFHETILRVPKSRDFQQEKIFDFIENSILRIMNNTEDDTQSDCTEYTHKRVHRAEEMRYRLYGKPVKPTSSTFLDELNHILLSSNRPAERRDSCLITHNVPSMDPIWLMFMPNVVDVGEICIELKPKGSLGPDSITHPKRYDGMAMKQRTCRYCMHQEWKFHNGKIPKRRPIEKEYCPIDLFSNDKERMRRAIVALMHDPQNNYKAFRPDGREITRELVAATQSRSTAGAFKDIAGMEKDELVHVIVEGLCQSHVLKDLHRAHELDEIDIEGIWALHQLIDSSPDLDPTKRMNARATPPGEQRESLEQLDHTIRRWFSTNGFTEDSNWNEIREKYRETLEKFLLATTMKDCSILLSIRDERILRDVSTNSEETWCEMEYKIEYNGHVYSVLVAVIDLDIKLESNLSKYYKLDQDIVHHYSENHGLHNKCCFEPYLPQEKKSQSQIHQDHDLSVQIKGNMMCRLLYPNPVCLLTVYDRLKHKANVMTITWLTSIDNHGTFVCSISKRRFTSELMKVATIFVLNIPTRDTEGTILAIGSSSGRATDKFRDLGLRMCCPGWSNGTSRGKGKRKKKGNEHHDVTKHAIALRDCIAHTVCRVREKQDMGQHWLFVCKQELAWSKKNYFADGKRFMRNSESLSPYLTFLGTQTFGSVV